MLKYIGTLMNYNNFFLMIIGFRSTFFHYSVAYIKIYMEQTFNDYIEVLFHI